MNAIEDAIFKSLKIDLTSDGFKLIRGGDFIRVSGDVEQIITPSLSYYPIDKGYNLEFFIAVRFQKVEELRRRYRTDLMPKYLARTKTISKFFINLVPEHYQWFFRTADDATPECIKDICEKLRTYAIPYLNRFSNLQALADTIKNSNDQSAYDITAEPNERFAILMAVYVALNDTASFKSHLAWCRENLKRPRISEVARKQFELLVAGVSRDFPQFAE